MIVELVGGPLCGQQVSILEPLPAGLRVRYCREGAAVAGPDGDPGSDRFRIGIYRMTVINNVYRPALYRWDGEEERLA